MNRSVKAVCCRSVPRCARCPVRLAATARLHRAAGARTPAARLVEEVLAGRPAPPLPPGVDAALAQLDEARRPRRFAR